MKKIGAILLALVMCLSLCTVAFAADTDSTSEETSILKVGAGNGEIVFTDAVFENNTEGFSGYIHENPNARILLIENGESVAIVSLELVGLSDSLTETIQKMVNEATGIPTENVWVHCNHTITTLHAPSDEPALTAYTNAVTSAVEEAIEEAVDSFQPATMGIGTGKCDVNANRDICIDGDWYYGLGSDMYSNKIMTIIRFDDLNGDPIGMYISYGIKPTAVDNTGKDDNLRPICTDVPGLACIMMEKEFGCPVMFCMPAAGDQIPKETCMFYEKQEDGSIVEVSLPVDTGYEIVDRLGTEMGNVAIKIASGIICDEENTTVTAEKTSFTYANATNDGTVSIDISAITVGDDLALVGFKPEINAVTEAQLQAASPYSTTLLVSFLDGDQKYMPDEEAYENGTWEYQRTGFGKGCAEEFVSVATTFLTAVQDGTYVAEDSSSDSGSSYLGGTIEMGGYTWTILSQSDKGYLVLCDQSVATKAYQEDGSAATWETSDIRAWLNGEFYEITFSDAEKALIETTTIANNSNLHYGIAAGNDTEDAVFLLSLDEAEAYIAGTDLAVLTDNSGNGVWWYLRSPGEAKDVAAGVSAAGVIDYHGTAGGMSEADAIRPAMWVSASVLDNTNNAEDTTTDVGPVTDTEPATAADTTTGITSPQTSEIISPLLIGAVMVLAVFGGACLVRAYTRREE